MEDSISFSETSTFQEYQYSVILSFLERAVLHNINIKKNKLLKFFEMFVVGHLEKFWQRVPLRKGELRLTLSISLLFVTLFFSSHLPIDV